MFKFMKSKKGFTLVELMIVVVIMAILVAVAVPIFSAVTKNAQEKTCNSNRREIVSQVSNYCMGGGSDGTLYNQDDSFKITSDGKKGTPTAGTGTNSKLTVAVINGMFQSLPYCPAGETNTKGTYTVELKAGAAGSTPTIIVYCDLHAAKPATT